METVVRSDVAELFAAAEFTREDAPDHYDDLALQMAEILDGLMARLSATMGLSWKRVEIYEEQKKSLIEDLKRMKREGPKTQ
jgi:hypothetical protein